MHFFKTDRRRALGPAVSLLVFALLVCGAWALLDRAQARSGDEQARLLKDALRRAAVSCYAVEGRYPASLGYLRAHYGVTVNEDRFIVRYDAFAENIMPDILVLERGKEMAAQHDGHESDD